MIDKIQNDITVTFGDDISAVITEFLNTIIDFINKLLKFEFDF